MSHGGIVIASMRGVCLLVACLAVSFSFAAEKKDSETEQRTESAARGYRFLTEKAYLPADFDQQTFDEVWLAWPKVLREQARLASASERQAMAFQRYGLTVRPPVESGEPSISNPESPLPLQYVVDSQGGWTMNCFTCHGGTVYGRPYPGAPNNRLGLQSLTEEIRRTKLRLGKPLARMDLGSLIMPLGSTEGRTNAVMFGVGLMHFRRPDLSMLDDIGPPNFTHHDMDAPPWWHFHRRPYLYIDGFAERGHRGLMQFMLVRENGPEKFQEWENDFRDVYNYMMSLRPPKFIGPVDATLAEQGRGLFQDHCARCHGRYGDGSPFPNVMVPLDEIGTDGVRLSALPVEGRKKYAASWFANAGMPDAQQTIVDPQGYVAPPLDGVWASAPYFHNGSVPTLWHVLNPDQRPLVWRRASEAMDTEKVGFQIEIVNRVPLTEEDPVVRRQYMDTRQFGKSAAGHEFPLELSGEERQAVLEYLKTL